MTALLIANTVAAVASLVFALLGGLRPATLTGSGEPPGGEQASREPKGGKPTSGERFYGWMYAVRGLPLGVAAGAAPLFWSGPAVALVLLAAAAAQAGDAAIGVVHRKWTMIAGAALLTVIHVVTAVAQA